MARSLSRQSRSEIRTYPAQCRIHGFRCALRVKKIKINKIKYKALIGTGMLGGRKVLFIKPQTYMNLSATRFCPHRSFTGSHRADPCGVRRRQYPPGKLRIKRNGSDGGHNGIKSIILKLGTSDFPRIKIGVGMPPIRISIWWIG